MYYAISSNHVPPPQLYSMMSGVPCVRNLRGTPKTPKDLKPHPCGEHERNTKKPKRSQTPSPPPPLAYGE